MQRLEELMQWQRQQQGKLLRHQEEQKALMNLEHKRLQEEIGLDKKDLAPGCSDKSMQDFETVSVKDVVDEITDNNEEVPQSFDDLPVNPVRKSFNDLLQEKLIVNEAIENNIKQKPKRPFLKKGEGLARFRLGAIKGTKSLKSEKKCITDKNSESNIASRGGTVSSNVTNGPSSREICEKLSPIRTEKQVTNACWSHALQNEPSSPRLPAFSKDSEDSGKEQDELRVFELLEQHAANSSFCSTSSVVTRFLGEPVKLPTKKVTFCSPIRSNGIKDAKSNKVPNNVNHPEKSGTNQVCRSKVKPHISNKTTNPGLRPCVLSKHPLHDFSEFPRRENPFFVSSNNNVASKKLVFGGSDADHVKQNCPIGLSNDHIDQDHSNDNGDPSKVPTSIYVLGKENTVQPIDPVPNHSLENESSNIPNNVHSDEFCDSQAWSDCSYSSSDETISGNECPASAPPEKEKIVSESVGNVSVPDRLTQHREVITFKSALLKERLAELENEIEIFKKENVNLRKLKKQHENDVTSFKKEKKEYEKLMKENTEKMQESILAERKKLAREKLVFEKYCKDVKNQPNKQEREEIKALKQQIADLQEELIRKDQRWSATQVRTRDRMRQLNKQIAILKEENDKLKAEKSQVKKVRFLNTKHGVGPNTRILHSVNEKLGKLKMKDMETPIVIKHVVPKKRIPDKLLCQNSEEIKESDLVKSNLKELKMSEQLVERFSEEENSSDSQEGSEQGGNSAFDYNNIYKKVIHHSNEAPLSKSLIYNAFYPCEKESLVPTRGREDKGSSYSIDEKEQTSGRRIKDVEDGIIQMATDVLHSTCKKTNDGSAQETSSEVENQYNVLVTKTSPTEAFVNDNSIEEIFLENVGDKTCTKVNVVENLLPDGTREKKFSDGRREIWYPNGNVKKLSADNLVTKMIYYNGDVKEKHHVDGTEKYYYSETKAWQTTYSDGREILEFPDGQIESKMPNGQRQITYHNGCSLLKNVDGSEEWSLADGTIVKKSVSGVQELIFPNGQKEIHTSEHKRREYPDGTVKYIYPDGTQETRYASGRVRLKDKDGNLIMDSSVR